MNLILLAALSAPAAPPTFDVKPRFVISTRAPAAKPAPRPVKKQSCTCGHGCQCQGCEGGECDCPKYSRTVTNSPAPFVYAPERPPASPWPPLNVTRVVTPPRAVRVPQTPAQRYYDPSPVPSYFRPTPAPVRQAVSGGC